MSDQKKVRANAITRSSILTTAAIAGLGTLGLCSRAQAADISKANNQDNLNTNSAWVGGVQPGVVDVALWNATVAGANTVSLGGDLSWGGIRIANPGGLVTINDNTLTLGPAGIDMSAATQGLTVNSGVTLLDSRAQKWSVASGITLNANGGFNRGAGATVDFDVTSGGVIHIQGLAASTAINYATINGGRDFAALDGAGNVVSRSTLLAYLANPNTAAALPNMSGVQNNVVDVINSNTSTPSAIRLSSGLTISNGLRFNTAHAGGLVWSVDHPSARVMNLGGSGLLIGPDVNTDVNFTGNGFTNFNSADGGFIRNYSANNLTFFNNVNGANGIVKLGPGRVIFASNGNNFANSLRIQEGTLQVGGGAATGVITTTAGVPVTNHGVIEFSRNNALTIANDISGPGAVSVNMVGAGVLQLTGNNTYTGATNLRGGLLELLELNDIGASTQLNFDGGGVRFGAGLTTDITSGGLSSSVGANGATVNTNGNDVTFANALGGGGAGALTKSGAGVLTLSATNAHTGAINVSGGTLRLSGSGGNGGVNVNTGGTLSGIGTSNGLLTVNSGGHVAPGASIGILNTAALTVNSGAILDFEFSGTSSSDRINVTTSDGLSINGGSVNVFADGTTGGFTGEGTYNIFQFLGSVQGGGTGALAVNNPQPGFTYNFGSSGGFVTLTVDQVAISSQWATDNSGSWNTGPWTGPVPNGVGSLALFTTSLSTPRTVTLDGSKTVGAAVFTSANGYTINPGSGGTLVVENTGGLGNSQLAVNSGAHQINVPLTLNTNTDVNVTAGASVLTLGGNIGGASALNKNGAGALVLSGSNSYAGQTTINAGTVEVASNTALSNTQVNFAGNSALRAGGNVTLANTLSIGNAVTATVDSQGNTLTLSGDINETSGNGVLTKTGSGTLVLTGNANHSGGTTIAAGALSIGNGGTSGAITNGGGTITNNGVLVYNRSDDGNLGNLITGTGALIKNGAGVLTLSNAGNNYAGGTTINTGTVRAQSTTPTGTGTVHLATTTTTLDLADFPITTGAVTGSGLVVAGAPVTHTINMGADATFDGRFDSGLITLAKGGAGGYTLTGNAGLGAHNLGGVAANGGTTTLNGATAEMNLATMTIGTGGAFRIDNGTLNVAGLTNILNTGEGCRFVVAGGTVNLNGGFNINRSAAANNDLTTGLIVSGGRLTVTTIELNSNNSWSNMAVSGGSVTITGGANAFLVADGSNVDRGGIFTQTGGELSYITGNPMILADSDAHAGATFTGGVANLDGIVIYSQGAVTNGRGTLTVNGGTVYVGANGITTNLTGLNAQSVPVTNVNLSDGTLGARADWSSPVDMNLVLGAGPGIALHAADSTNAPFNISLSGVLSGAGNLIKTGAGSVNLTGANTYTGSSTVSAGKLVLGPNAHAPVLTGAGGGIVNGGRLIFDYTGGATVGPAVLAILDAGQEQAPRFSSGQLRTTNPDDANKGLGWVDDSLTSTVTVAYTYLGDTNLDGQVDITDLGTLATNWQAGGDWATGDFNYSGLVDITDLGALATNWQAGVGNPLGPDINQALASVGLGGASVPEPASIGLVGLGVMGLARRRRRQ